VEQGVWQQKVDNLKNHEVRLRQNPIWQNNPYPDQLKSELTASAEGEQVTYRTCVILVEFPDFRHDDDGYDIPGGGFQPSRITTTPAMFDSLLFSQRGIDPVSNPTGSMTEFYLENSYGEYLITGDIHGWYTMPHTYDWYVGVDDGMTGGAYLAVDAVDAAEAAGVDFSLYATGGSVPGVTIVHAGPGAESGAYGVWSHRSVMASSRQYDGVWITNYAMDPEELGSSISSVGVFCHEWGHILGLPDLYDIDYNPGSVGLGHWSVMAGGSWNYSGRSPAHFDAYCKWELGFSDVEWLGQNLPDAPIPQAESSPVAYGLKEEPTGGITEVWMVENRQQVGFDSHLRGSGLCIYHVDFSVSTQNNPDRYRVALEQADGLNEMATMGSSGDLDDPWPGGTDNRNFSDFSVPNAHTNRDDSPTEVGVWNISDSDSLMFADLELIYTRPYVVLEGDSITISDAAPGGNGDGILMQGETVEIDIEVRNVAKQTFNPTLTLSVDRSGIDIVQNDVDLNAPLNPIFTQHTEVPIIFTITESFVSSLVTFTLDLTSDSSYFPGGDQAFHSYFEFEMYIGDTQVLLVDDDGGDNDEGRFSNALTGIGILYDTFEKSSLGTPSVDTLSHYNTVFWMTGDPSVGGGTLTASDVSVMQQFLDAGGNLALASMAAPEQLQALDSAFMADYLHANLAGTQYTNYFRGVSSHPVGDGLRYATDLGYTDFPILSAVGEGEEAIVLTDLNDTEEYGACGVAFAGDDYKTVFLSFPIEWVKANAIGNGLMPPDSLVDNILNFFYGDPADCCIGIRGNIDCVQSDQIDGVDLAVLLDHLFFSLAPLCCEAEADLDGNLSVDGIDLDRLIRSLFITLEPLPPCP